MEVTKQVKHESKSNEKKQPGEPEQEQPFETCDHQEQERILDIA